MHKHRYGYETYEGYDRLVCVAPDCDMKWPHRGDLNRMEDVLEAAVELLQHDKELLKIALDTREQTQFSPLAYGAVLLKLYDSLLATGRVDEIKDLGKPEQP